MSQVTRTVIYILVILTVFFMLLAKERAERKQQVDRAPQTTVIR